MDAQWIAVIVMVVLAAIGGFTKIALWVIGHRHVSEENSRRLEGVAKWETNHLRHHEEKIEPQITKIREDVGYIKGKLDRHYPE